MFLTYVEDYILKVKNVTKVFIAVDCVILTQFNLCSLIIYIVILQFIFLGKLT